MSTATAPVQKPGVVKKVGIGKSIAWAGGMVAALPVALGLLWVLGLGGSKVRDLIGKVGLSWGQVGIGLAILAGFAAIVGTVHLVRLSRARVERYEAVIEDLA